MAIQPKDLKGKLAEVTKATCDALEKHLDEHIKKTYNEAGSVRFDIKNASSWTQAVEKEMKKRYKGWVVSYHSWSDQRDNDSGQYIILTPKKTRATPKSDHWDDPRS